MRVPNYRKHLVTIILTLCLCLGSVQAMAGTDRIMVLGDSWATFMRLNDTFNRLLRDYGLRQYEATSLQFPGTEASDWNTWYGRWAIASNLMTMPSVDIVVLSIGGNDFFAKFSFSADPVERYGVLAAIEEDVADIVDHILSVRPDVKVCMIGYDYPNFEESLESGWPLDSAPEYLADLGYPTTEELNTQCVAAGQIKMDLAMARDRVEYVNNFGLMQWFFGYGSKGIQPMALPFPGYEKDGTLVPGGDVRLPSPPAAMWQVWGQTDCIHLNDWGFYLIGANAMNQVIVPWLLAN